MKIEQLQDVLGDIVAAVYNHQIISSDRFNELMKKIETLDGTTIKTIKVGKTSTGHANGLRGWLGDHSANPEEHTDG